MYKFIIQICIWICTNLWLEGTTKKTYKSKKRASPLSSGMREYEHLAPKILRHRPYTLRHRHVQFCFCTRTIRITIQELRLISIHFHAIANSFVYNQSLLHFAVAVTVIGPVDVNSLTASAGQRRHSWRGLTHPTEKGCGSLPSTLCLGTIKMGGGCLSITLLEMVRMWTRRRRVSAENNGNPRSSLRGLLESHPNITLLDDESTWPSLFDLFLWCIDLSPTPRGMTMIVTSKGYMPITLVIIHCKGEHGGEEADQPGQDLESFNSGAFIGLSAMDVAVKYGNKEVFGLLHCCRMTRSAPGHWKNSTRPGWAWPSVWPAAPLSSFPQAWAGQILSEQESVKGQIWDSGKYVGGRSRKRRNHISWKCLDQLMTHSNGKAWVFSCRDIQP